MIESSVPGAVAADQAATRQVTATVARRYRRFLPLAGSLLGVALAGVGEMLVESKDRGGYLSLALYLAGIAVFAVSSWPLWSRESDLPVGAQADPGAEPAASRRAWVVVGAGVGLALGMNIAAFFLVRQELPSTAGLLLWLGSLLVITATGVVGRRTGGWPARWVGGVLPSSRHGRVLLFVAVVLILLVAAVARLALLDKVPFGINADEGDRAATAIQIVRGQNTRSIFDSGWYWISMLYFWLLAQVLKLFGIGFAQARIFGALASVLSVAIITWIGVRHFNLRVGLVAGALLSTLAVSLQFARETSEAGPTATLWALSAAFFLEAARGGRLWAWIGAGLAGGFSFYFYPSGRLWAVVAAGFCLYLLVRGIGVPRLQIVRGIVLAALASAMVISPFLANSLRSPEVMTQRASETSIFTKDNPTRLSYYKPEWSMVELLGAQVEHSIGIFNQYKDEGGFWPTDKPIASGLLAVLMLLGIGWVSTRWRDPRFVLLAIWFWVGIVGMIVTVETPNLQRMATAVPLLALLVALVIENLARGVEALGRRTADGGRRAIDYGRWVTGGAAALVVLFIAVTQVSFYFDYYGKQDRWPQATIQGKAVADQGTGTLVLTLGRQFHMVNSGWVRLMAPDARRAGVQAPGTHLPLAVPAESDLAFMIYPRQVGYLPYVQSLYPGGVTTTYTHTTENTIVTAYRISQEQWASTQGAEVETPDGTKAHVSSLGILPEGWNGPAGTMRWRAALRVPKYWAYVFRVARGPARLTIDGVPVLDAPATGGAASVALARGDHAVLYEAEVAAGGQGTAIEWRLEPENGDNGDAKSLEWRTPAAEELTPGITAPRGLMSIVQIAGEPPRPEQRRLDNTLATCCLSLHVHNDDRPYTVQWTGTLHAPATGVYSMTLFVQGAVDFKIGGSSVFKTSGPTAEPIGAEVGLSKGPHPVEVNLSGMQFPGGIEWIWTPPGGETSIVPPSVLSPPAGAGIYTSPPPGLLDSQEFQPVDVPTETVP